MAEIVWESDAQMSGFTVMSNGMVWPDDWPGTLVEAQFTSARGDGADLDRDPDMVPSGPGLVTFTPLVRTVGYDGEHGKRIVSMHPFEAVVGDDGYLYTPDEYGQPGIRGIVLPSNNSDVVDEHDWTWRVTFDIPDTTIRPTHIPTPHRHSVDIKDYLDSDANHGVRVVVDRVAARETLTARDEVIQARDLVLPARDQTLAARDETLQHGITVDTSVGTRVFVGDTMIYYDSGWRDIFDALPADSIDKDRGGIFQVRRTLDEVQFFARFFVSEELAGSGQGASILLWDSVHVSFRQTPAIYGTLFYGATSSGHPIRLSNSSSSAHLRIYRDAGGDWEAGYTVSFSGAYKTTQSVPSTSSSLPGTPL